MKTYTIADLRALAPCYDPTKYLPEDWTGTLIDLLEVKEATPADRIWVAIKLLDKRGVIRCGGQCPFCFAGCEN